LLLHYSDIECGSVGRTEHKQGSASLTKRCCR